MRLRRDRYQRCERCGRRVLHGKTCRPCRDSVQRQLDQARGLVNTELVARGYGATIGLFRAQIRPETGMARAFRLLRGAGGRAHARALEADKLGGDAA